MLYNNFHAAENISQGRNQYGPNLADTWKILGDMYFEKDPIQKKRAIDAYSVALSMPTQDTQILKSLGNRLKKLGLPKKQK